MREGETVHAAPEWGYDAWKERPPSVARLDASLDRGMDCDIAFGHRVVREQAETYGRRPRSTPASSREEKGHEERIDGTFGTAGEMLVGTAEPDPEIRSGDVSGEEEVASEVSGSDGRLVDAVRAVPDQQDPSVHDVHRSVARCHDRMCVLTHQLLTLGPHRLSEFKAAKAVRDDLAHLRKRLEIHRGKA